jgi:hypothetical protein
VHSVIVVVGLILATIGCALELRGPARFDRGKAVGLALFLLGEVLLFTEGWWWGLLGLLAPPLPIQLLLAATQRR